MSASNAIVVASAARTPVGSFNGAFANTPAHELGAVAIKEALERAGVDGKEVDEVILGQVLTAGAGPEPGAPGGDRRRPARRRRPPGASTSSAARACAPSRIGMQQIATGDAKIIVAGGQESMSMAPHCQHLRAGVKMGDFKMIDTMIKDGLIGRLLRLPHGQHGRERRPPVAAHARRAGRVRGRLAEQGRGRAEGRPLQGRDRRRSPIKGRKGDTIVDQDEYIRHGATLEAMQKLKPAFDKEGTVTAANASGINDGAAAVVLMSEAEAARRGITPLVRIVSWATAGVDPQIMGTGPIPASRKALEKAGWSVGDLDLVEANEAFAAQACAVNKDMGWNPDIVNVNGGAIAIGHPIGASGARIFNTLVYEMKRRGAKKGLATLCIGGGMGVAMCVEAMN